MYTCSPVLPDVLGQVAIPHSSHTCLTVCATSMTPAKPTPSGSRSITIQSGRSRLPTREFQGFISTQPSCTIYKSVGRSPPTIQCRSALFDSEKISVLGTQGGKCSLFFWKKLSPAMPPGKRLSEHGRPFRYGNIYGAIFW